MKVTSLTRVTQPQAVKRRSVLTNVVLGDRLTEDRGRTNPGPSGAGAPQAVEIHNALRNIDIQSRG
jgi:hypothetical protein